MSNITQIPAARIPLLEQGANRISREWFRYLQELGARVGITSTAATLLDGLVEVSEDYTPTDDDLHIVCTGTLTITLPTLALRDSELIVTNAGTGVISFTGTINGNTDMQIGYQWTTVRLRPTLLEWVVV